VGYKLAEGKGLREGMGPVKTTGMQKPQVRKDCGNLWKRVDASGG
jgi:hypothetical protein